MRRFLGQMQIFEVIHMGSKKRYNVGGRHVHRTGYERFLAGKGVFHRLSFLRCGRFSAHSIQSEY